MSNMKNERNFYKRYSIFCGRNCIKMLLVPSKMSESALNLNVGKMDSNNWIALFECLPYDKVLTKISIRSPKDIPFQLSDFDSLKKLTRLPIGISSIATKYMMKRLSKSVSLCLRQTDRLTTLSLEGLPLSLQDIEIIMEGLSRNHSVQYLSFQRCKLKIQGFTIICRGITYLSNVESLNVSRCELNSNCVESIVELIKAQCAFRFSEAWKHSLRYRNINVNQIRGLKYIAMNGNPSIGDEGVQCLLNALIDDVWLEKIELKECGITDNSGNLILNLLEKKYSKLEVDVHNNDQLSKNLCSRIQFTSFATTTEEKHCSSQTKKKLKEEIQRLKSELQLEKLFRKQSDQICLDLKRKLSEQNIIPDNYTLIKTDILEQIQSKTRGNKKEVPRLNRSHLNVPKSIYTQQRAREPDFNTYELIGDAQDIDFFAEDDVNALFLGGTSAASSSRSTASSATSEFVSSFSSF